MHRYKQEMQLAARQAEEEKVRQREAAAKDAAAKEKTDRARMETERILAKQQAEIELKKACSPHLISQSCLQILPQ